MLGIQDKHLESFLSLCVNIDLYFHDKQSILSIQEVIRLYDEYKLSEGGKKAILDNSIHGGIFVYLEMDRIAQLFGGGLLPKLMQKKLYFKIKELKKKYEKVKNVHTFHHRILELRKTPSAPSSTSVTFKSSFSSATLSKSNESKTTVYPSVPSYEEHQTDVKETSEKKVDVVENSESDRVLCKICFFNPLSCSINCGHSFCDICVGKIKKCPFCRQEIKEKRKLFL